MISDIRHLRIGNILNYKGEMHYVSMLSLDIDDEYTELIGVTPLGKRSGEKSDWIRAFGHDLNPVDISETLLKSLGYEWEKDWEAEDPETGEKEVIKGSRWHILRNGKSIGVWLCVNDSGEFYFPPSNSPIVRHLHHLQNMHFVLVGDELPITL